MLEPYTPKYEAEEHRPSCSQNDSLKKRTSFSSKIVLSSVNCTPGNTNFLNVRGNEGELRLRPNKSFN